MYEWNDKIKTKKIKWECCLFKRIWLMYTLFLSNYLWIIENNIKIVNKIQNKIEV